MHRRSRALCTFQPRPPRIVLTLRELSVARLAEQGATVGLLLLPPTRALGLCHCGWHIAAVVSVIARVTS